MLVILACKTENEDQVNVMIDEKRKQLLRKLQRKMRRLNAPRTQELAGWMQNMLINDDKETLAAEYIPQRHFEMNIGLVQKFASAQEKARRNPDML